MFLRPIFISLSMVTLCSCAISSDARYIAPSATPTAVLSIQANSDSSGVTGMHYKAILFPDNNCKIENRNLLGQELMGKDSISMSGGAIPAGRPIRVGLFYSESRPGEIRSCTAMLEFTPNGGESYNARFRSDRQAATCTMALIDHSGAQVSADIPGDCDYDIGVGGSKKYKYKVELQR